MTPITAADLRIDVRDPSSHGLYKWLLASFLIGKRIRSSVAVEAYRNLVDRHGLDTPDKLAGCSHRDLVRFLGQAGYARYDESTATRLHELGVGLAHELEARTNAVKRGFHKNGAAGSDRPKPKILFHDVASLPPDYFSIRTA